MRRLFLFVLFGSLPAWAFDPYKVIVEDESVELFAELPSGHTDLRTYRAPYSVIEAYSKEKKVEGGDIKDFPKAPDCTRAEIHALKLWGTNDIYERVNRALRNVQEGKLDGAPLSSTVELEIQMIASGVNCAPQYEGPVVRMEKAPEWLLTQYRVPNFLGMRGFTSTTKGSTPAPYFLENYLHQINIPKARGADIDSLGIAQWPGEKEVLIRPGTVFKVTSRQEFPGMRPSHMFRWEMSFTPNVAAY